MSEEKKDSVTVASLPIEITILLFGSQNLEWYTLGVKWSLASPKLVPLGAVIPIFRWAHQVDPLVSTIPPPPPRAARARSHCQSKDSKIMNKCTSCIRQEVLTTG